MKIQGPQLCLWQAVDQDGDVLDILVTKRRNKRAAKRFFRKVLKGQGKPPWRLITDKLRSYPAAHREVFPSVEHGTRQYENNRAEVSHLAHLQLSTRSDHPLYYAWTSLARSLVFAFPIVPRNYRRYDAANTLGPALERPLISLSGPSAKSATRLVASSLGARGLCVLTSRSRSYRIRLHVSARYPLLSALPAQLSNTPPRSTAVSSTNCFVIA